MSFIPEGFGEVVVTYSQAGTIRPAQWTMGVRPGVTEDLPGYAAALSVRYNAAGGPLVTSQYDANLTAINLRFTYMSDTGPLVWDEPLNLPGTRTGESMPPNVAVLARRNTARGGRRGRGRLYLPSGYLSEADVQEGGVVATARRTALQDLITAAATRIATAAGTEAVLLHNDGVVPPDTIESMTLQTTVATMRRRLRK